MANPDFPQNREEMLLNAIAGSPYDVPAPVPQSRVEKWLAFLAENGIPGNVKIGEDVATVADLPAEGAVGEMHYVTAESLFYVYKVTDGTGEWIPVGADFDPSEFARADGNYPDMTVGKAEYADVAEYSAYADQLDATVKTTVNGQFVFRPAGGGADVEGYLGSKATIAAVYGNTLVWNQLVDADTTEVTLKSNHVYLTRIDGTDALVSGSGTSVSVTGGTDNVFDLTQMFGAGNVPASAEAFRAFFPLPYYAYDTGRLLNFTGTGIRTVGFNQWDEEWGLGYIRANGDYHPEATGTQIASVSYIPVIAGLTYRFDDNRVSGNGPIYRVCVYDANKNFVGTYINVYSNRSIVIPEGGAYVRFSTSDNYGNTYKNDISIHLVWSGYRNGEYEPYRTETKALPVSTYFPNGMNSINSVRDELTKDKAVKRIKSVKVSELDWQYYADGIQHGFFFANAESRAAVGNAININCADYVPYGNGATTLATYGQYAPDRSCGGGATSGRIYIRDDRYTTKNALIAGMGDTTILYELSSGKWEETPIDPPPDMTFRSSDYGTEMLIPENTSAPVTSPMYADIRYVQNLRDKLQRLPNGVAEGDYYVHSDGVNQEYKPLPTVPTADGVYTLKCTATSGTPAFAWVADAETQTGPGAGGESV